MVPRRKKNLPAFVKFLRAGGVASLLIGFGGGVLADRFWLGIALCYVGVAAFAVDVWFEPELFGKWRAKGIAWGVILLLTMAFTWEFILIPAPLAVAAFVTDGEFPIGTVISGISWRPEVH